VAIYVHRKQLKLSDLVLKTNSVKQGLLNKTVSIHHCYFKHMFCVIFRDKTNTFGNED